ncbi:MAG: 30S ribosomal protein S4 [Parcubacteria group bacterium GW2011_GWE2_39_37]|uniref:Small ribosomal subunit protein uS4 n=1 Tax=Candidatus Falkowbacteria bacterium GW2011_GWF2_39_8 TaxID=1618642 RepID=A0A0G0PTI2_9BACT|nr:MAG: 30S ribosomal protein S4 [Parcubacteria group bacterium GW2011_GWE2_39_37]KKR31489.1 MAG: 30S ribosomal protein S4 [Candidatus Falkowbacteria bacterium GW2011_GWF2_39_8]
MGRYLGPRTKYLRRFGLLPQKTQQRIFKKNKTAYGQRLEEKQKLKFIYDISEKQFSRYVNEAIKSHEDPALFLFRKLEMRLDNVIFSFGFARSRQEARQLVSHGHVFVNDNKIDIPSYQVIARDNISMGKNILDKILEREKISERKPENLPGWLGREDGLGIVRHYPAKSDIRRDVDFELIIEFYS